MAIAASNGYSFWFSADSGKIWAVDSSDNVTLCFTTHATTGGSGCLGAIEYNGYIYWATENYLHRIAIASADGFWTGLSENWQALSIGDASFHPMAIQDLTLFIGDGYRVASVDEDDVFISTALDINTPNRIKCMIAYEFDLLLGTYIADTVNKSEIIRWDTVSPSWNTSDEINEAGINAFIRDDNYMLVSAGKYGRIYYYNGSTLEPYQRILGEYSNTKTGIVHPGSFATYDGVPIFGFSNVEGNPAPQGIYALGSYSRNYNKVLTLDYVISDNVTSNIEIGAILVIDGLIYVAWKRGTVYAIDRLDMTAKYTGAYLTTRMLEQENRSIQKTLAQVAAYYNSLPTGTGFTFSYSINGADFVDMTSVTNAVINEVVSQETVPDVGSYQIKCAFNVNGNQAPTLEALSIDTQ